MLKSLQKKKKTTPSRAKRRPRQLPPELRSLTAVVELTNLISQAEFERFYGEYQRLLLEPSPATRALTSFIKKFPARCHAPAYRDAMAILAKNIAAAKLQAPEKVNPFTLFETIATLRNILRTVAVELNPLQSSPTKLPSDSPPVLLGNRDGRIQISAVPVSYWLLPMLVGVEIGRLGICEACHKLYIARRRDQLGCSRTCGDTLYMRRYRTPEYRNRNKPDKASVVRFAGQFRN